MLTRREFQLRLIASFALLAARPGFARAETSPSADLWLNRLTFGATPALRADFVRLGVSGWLEDQLAQPVMDDALAQRLQGAKLRIAYEAGQDENGHHWPARDELRGLTQLDAAPADQVALTDWALGMDYAERARPAAEVIAASMIRAVHAKAQLREVMTQFWHDHFNVNSAKNEAVAAFFPSYDKVMRGNALGNFRLMLGEVARAPSMLYYLNNDESRASPANENFARELLELHTLGAGNYLNARYHAWADVPGAAAGMAEGYLDLDVYEVARAFTGWSVGDGRWLSEGVNAPRSGQFFYVSQWHDPYQKRVLGREFLPNRAPMADGDDVLDMLARHPGTARFICTKLARRLLADDPPLALVDRMATEFLAKSDDADQIAAVLRVLVLSDEFTSTAPSKLRRPFEFLAALYRGAGVDIMGTEAAFQWPLQQAGWMQHEFGPPTGHPDRMGDWTGASSLNRLVDLAINALSDWFAVAAPDAAVTLAAVLPGETTADFLARAAAAIAPETGADVAQILLKATGADPSMKAADVATDERAESVRMAMALAALSPDFMLR